MENRLLPQYAGTLFTETKKNSKVKLEQFNLVQKRTQKIEAAEK